MTVLEAHIWLWWINGDQMRLQSAKTAAWLSKSHLAPAS